MNSQTTKIFIGIIFIVLTLNFISALTISNVETNPQQVAPGETARIIVELENNFDEDVEKVNVMLDFNSEDVPIAPFGGSSEASVESIDSDDKERISFDVIVLPEAVSGVYKIPIKINYRFEGENETFEKEGTISLVVNSPAKIRTSIEGNLVKGRESELTLRIINDGLSDIKLASVNIQQTTSIVIKSPTYEYLGNIDSDDFDSIDLIIFTNENAPSLVSVPVVVTYKDATNKDFSQSEVLTIRAYSQDEAKELGLIDGPNYTLYIVIGILILIYIVYRVRKRVKRKRILGVIRENGS